MTANVRIGCGAGYAGDRIEPAVDLIRQGQLDYVIFECLAERTIALAQQRRRQDDDAGYDELLPERMRRILPQLQPNGVRLISNMGAANPVAAVAAIRDIARSAGVSGLRIAAVIGDDLTPELDRFLDRETLETRTPLTALRNRLVSANAYTGARAIAEALEGGADLVITGRAADPALTVAPLMFEFGRKFDDWEFLGKATLAGHLLECGTQLTGGYFADPGYKDVDELWNVGLPIAEVDASGETRLSKLAGSGGELSKRTVKEQLLYEIHDPSHYLTPDVVADFSGVSVQAIGKDEVAVSGATGRAKTGQLKVSIGYLDGFVGEGEISYGGDAAIDRARLAADVLSRRFEAIGLAPREFRIDLIGVDSLFGAPHGQECAAEVRLRVAGRLNTKEDARLIGREVEALYTNGPAAGGGARRSWRQIVAIESILVPEDTVEPEIQFTDV